MNPYVADNAANAEAAHAAGWPELTPAAARVLLTEAESPRQ